MNITDIKVGDKVVYIPHRLLVGEKSKMIKEENLGEVTSLNDTYAFVRYKDKSGSQATKPEDLYSLKYRPDLDELIIK